MPEHADAEPGDAPIGGLTDQSAVERVTFRPATNGYDVYLDDTRIGRVWKRPNRSFSGAWSGVDSSGRSVGSFHRTRREAVENILRAEGSRAERGSEGS